VKILWQRDLNGPLKDGFHPINGYNGEVYISRDDLLAILTFDGEIELTTFPLAADPNGIIIHKILGIAAWADGVDGIGSDGVDCIGSNGIDGFGKK
jgi:hypothetical protein